MATNDSTLPLENISEAGKTPDMRVGSASDANAIARILVEANRQRSQFNSKIKGMFQGAPPYDAAKLRAAGQAYRANVNFREAKAARSAALVPYYDLFSGAKYYAQVRTAKKGTAQDQREWSDIITEEFDWMLRTYTGFDFNMQKMLNELVGYGSGFHMWHDNSDWHFTCATRAKVYVPDGTDACVDNLDVLVFRERMSVHKLYGFIRNKEAATAVGWNIQATVDAIVCANPEQEGESSTQYNYEWLQQKMKDRDIMEGVRSPTVPVAHVLVKEFDGTVTHQMIYERSGTTKYEKNVKEQFLYVKKGRFKEFRNFIAGFFLEILDGSWNGVEGIGHDIFSTMSIKDRLKCSVVDQVFLKCGITMQATTAAALQKTSLIQAGVFNIIPPDYNVQQSTILGDSNSPLLLDRTFDNMLVANTGVYRQRAQKEDGNPITAEQAKIDQTNSTVLSNSSVNRFYLDLDRLYQEIYRRASNPNLVGETPGIKAAKEFQQRCERRGVPMAAIVDVEYVRAHRNAGNGSVYMRQQNIQATENLVPMLPESGKQNFLDYALASIHGQSMVSLFNPPEAKMKLPDDQMALAMLENAALRQNAPVAWTPTQNNVIHAQVHLQSAGQAAGSLQQGGEPGAVLAYLDAVGQHTAIHLQHLSTDPTRKEQYDTLQEQWQQLAALTDKLKKQVEEGQKQQQEQQQKSAQAQQVQQGQDPDSQIAMAKAQQDMKIKQAKAEQSLKQKDAKTAQDMALKNAKAISESQRQASKAKSSDK